MLILQTTFPGTNGSFFPTRTHLRSMIHAYHILKYENAFQVWDLTRGCISQLWQVPRSESQNPTKGCRSLGRTAVIYAVGFDFGLYTNSTLSCLMSAKINPLFYTSKS